MLPLVVPGVLPCCMSDMEDFDSFLRDAIKDLVGKANERDHANSGALLYFLGALWPAADALLDRAKAVDEGRRNCRKD
jgi:hypothetical protein